MGCIIKYTHCHRTYNTYMYTHVHMDRKKSCIISSYLSFYFLAYISILLLHLYFPPLIFCFSLFLTLSSMNIKNIFSCDHFLYIFLLLTSRTATMLSFAKSKMQDYHNFNLQSIVTKNSLSRSLFIV